jgi:hypothetical protein
MHMKYTDAKRALTDAERKGNVFKEATQEHKDEVVRLKGRLDILEALEGEYKSWKSREPEVRHYLRNFAAIARWVEQRCFLHFTVDNMAFASR